MVEYRVLSTFVSRRLNTDLKDFTFDLWKKRGTMKTVKICSGNIGLREVNIGIEAYSLAGKLGIIRNFSIIDLNFINIFIFTNS